MNHALETDVNWVLVRQAADLDLPDDLTELLLEKAGDEPTAPGRLTVLRDAASARTHRMPTRWLALGGIAALLSVAFAVGHNAVTKPDPPGSQTATGGTTTANNSTLGAGPRATGAIAASSQVGSGQVSVSEYAEAGTGDALVGQRSEVKGVVGAGASVQNSNTAIAPVAVSAPVLVANGGKGQVAAGAAAVAAQTSQVGSRDDSRIVREASLELLVEDGGFESAWSAVNEIATKHRGHVSDSSAERGAEALSTGTVTVRVPATRFSAALEDLRALGEVQSLAVSTTDVSGQLVDMEARVRALTAQEQALLAILAKAGSIEDTLEVRDRISSVRLEIEQLNGRRASLEDQIELATISMTIRGEEAAPAAPRTTFWQRTGLARAGDTALDASLGIVGGLIVMLGYAVPLGLLAVAAFAVYRNARGRRFAIAPPSDG